MWRLSSASTSVWIRQTLPRFSRAPALNAGLVSFFRNCPEELLHYALCYPLDPSSVSPQKAMELIGANLQKQYERWQPRARYKKFHDPTIEDVKKLCTSLRRNAKEERVLFHYNGHGVPRPTENGEIWVFNKTYTQYIPLSIYDLQTWMGAPSIYVYDCSNAGMIVNSFNQFAETHENEMQKALNTSGNRGQSPGANVQLITYKNCIQLAACSANQILPMNHQLPADLFTSCLTTPIKIALKWYTMQRTSMLVPQINSELIEKYGIEVKTLPPY